ncbi:MAG: hypothetical protein N4A57_14045 [Anaeromicrobium sp.]|jgi:hypothetical protein|uniref:hypothetical protein n=1 Tax=Anaeromicrobium sp. TaxID=1929132 RepID=UPI0025FAE2A1|nr:hypothetical protein [Anaeromicrobium sp.]MCT4595368.1 hypothetical protein [Anaeromicrobium sp.]
MKRTIIGKMEKGMDNLIKLTTSLRRKEFYISELEIKEFDINNSIKITFDETKGHTADKAALYLKKFSLLNSIQIN